MLQSGLPALAQAEAQACKGLIDAFNAWFAANYASQSGAFDANHLVITFVLYNGVMKSIVDLCHDGHQAPNRLVPDTAQQ